MVRQERTPFHRTPQAASGGSEFRAGEVPERPQKVGCGPLRSLRPPRGLRVRPDPLRLVRGWRVNVGACPTRGRSLGHPLDGAARGCARFGPAGPEGGDECHSRWPDRPPVTSFRFWPSVTSPRINADRVWPAFQNLGFGNACFSSAGRVCKTAATCRVAPAAGGRHLIRVAIGNGAKQGGRRPASAVAGRDETPPDQALQPRRRLEFVDRTGANFYCEDGSDSHS